jgi:CHASE2 domain-containing sensor protein
MYMVGDVCCSVLQGASTSVCQGCGALPSVQLHINLVMQRRNGSARRMTLLNLSERVAATSLLAAFCAGGLAAGVMVMAACMHHMMLCSGILYCAAVAACYVSTEYSGSPTCTVQL